MKKVPLIVEPHPQNYDGYKFITLLKYNDETSLNIIDNYYNKVVTAYVLDLCSPLEIDENLLINVAYEWYNESKNQKYPFSIELSRKGLSGKFSKILRTYPVDFISRVIGPLPSFPMGGYSKIKKRKKKDIPSYLEFVDKTIKI
jgi:hypothetical protein